MIAFLDPCSDPLKPGYLRFFCRRVVIWKAGCQNKENLCQRAHLYCFVGLATDMSQSFLDAVDLDAGICLTGGVLEQGELETSDLKSQICDSCGAWAF